MLDAIPSKPEAKLPTAKQCQTQGLMLDAMASKPEAKLPTAKTMSDTGADAGCNGQQTEG